MGVSEKERSLLERVEADKEKLIDLCASLIRINTVNPYSGDPQAEGEAKGQQFLARTIAGLGGAIEFMEPPADVYRMAGVIGPKDRSFAGRPNLTASFSVGTGVGPTVLLNGHMDTVSATDMTIPPFSGALSKGALWGRGSSDCKGGIATGLMAVAAILGDSDDLNGTILFDSVVDEECNGSGAGTIASCLLKRHPDAAIFLDGEAGRVATGCSGCLTAQVMVEGETAHGSSGLGVNAIDKAFLVKKEIDKFKMQREKSRPEARTNLGLLKAGVHPAVVPGKAEMQINIVYELDEAEEARSSGGRWGGDRVMGEFLIALAQSQKKDAWLNAHPAQTEWIKDLPPFEIPQEDPLVQLSVQCFQDVLGKSPAIGPIAAWTDAAFQSIIEARPTVLMGPALPHAAHAPDERVLLDDLVTTCKVVALMLHRLLNPPAS